MPPMRGDTTRHGATGGSFFCLSVATWRDERFFFFRLSLSGLELELGAGAGRCSPWVRGLGSTGQAPTREGSCEGSRWRHPSTVPLDPNRFRHLGQGVGETTPLPYPRTKTPLAGEHARVRGAKGPPLGPYDPRARYHCIPAG